MKYYIYENNSWHQVHVELEPKYVKAFDTTNDTLSCILKANNKADSYLPMTPFKIEETIGNDTETTILWIINDTVDIFSLKPLRYKHTFNIVQYRYFLNKHSVRNTVFNQPRKNKIELYGSVSTALKLTIPDPNSDIVNFDWCQIQSDTSTKEPNYWSDKITLNNHTRIKNFSYKLDVYLMGAFNMYKASSFPSEYNIQFNTCYFDIIDLNNNNTAIARIYLDNNSLSGQVADEQTLEDINTYIANHRNATLALKYWNGSAISPYSETHFGFLRAVNYSMHSLIEGTTIPNPAYVAATECMYATGQLTITLEIYNYTMYDVLDTLLNQYRLSSQIDYKRDLLFNIPDETTDLGKLLRSTYPKDTLSFTQSTFYDALTEIFRYYDAGFKFDENKTLQIEYYNNPIDEIEPTLTGRKITHSDKNFNNGRIAYYQNALMPIKIPRITVRSKGLGVPEMGDYGILLEKSIYNVGKISVDAWGKVYPPQIQMAGVSYFVANRFKLDLTPFLVNDSEYSVLDKADPDGFSNGDDATIKYQSSVLHFSRGGDFIQLDETYQNGNQQTIYKLDNVLKLAAARFFGFGILQPKSALKACEYPTYNEWTEQVFSIEYLTMNNGRSVVETANYKYNGQQIVNQNNGLIDINKLGLNILGEALKDGEPVLSANLIITNWANRIKEGDYFVDENDGGYWVANVVNYTEISQDKYRCTVEFSKNFNALSLRVQSDKEKRLTNISSESAVLSEDDYTDYIYVCDPNNLSNYEIQRIILNEEIFGSMISQTFKGSVINNKKDIKFGVVDTFYRDGSVNKYGSDTPKKETRNRYIPILKYGAGNCICFEAQFKDPLNAGNQLIKSTGWFGTDKYFSQAALYTDDDGWADTFDIKYCDLTASGEINDIGDFPVIDGATFNTYIQVNGEIKQLVYFKKPNEIFALNYEWCFLVAGNKQDIFIGNKFINVNTFTNKEEIANKTFYVRYTLSSDNNNERYSILDTKGIGTHTQKITGIVTSVDTTNHTFKIGFNVASGFTAKNWAIVDENNDIYFARNKSTTFYSSGTHYHLGFFPRRVRKDY